MDLSRMKTYIEYHHWFSGRGESKQQGVLEIEYTQPLWRYVIAQIYQFYAIQGWKLMKPYDWVVDKWLMRGNPKSWETTPLSSDARRDLRCYDLSQKGRKDVRTIKYVYESESQHKTVP